MLNKGYLLFTPTQVSLISKIDHGLLFTVRQNKRNKSDAVIGKVFAFQTLLERRLSFPLMWI